MGTFKKMKLESKIKKRYVCYKMYVLLTYKSTEKREILTNYKICLLQSVCTHKSAEKREILTYYICMFNFIVLIESPYQCNMIFIVGNFCLLPSCTTRPKQTMKIQIKLLLEQFDQGLHCLPCSLLYQTYCQVSNGFIKILLYQASRLESIIEKLLFFYFSTKTYVGTQKNRLNETVLLSTKNKS